MKAKKYKRNTLQFGLNFNHRECKLSKLRFVLKSDDDLSGFRPLFGRSYGSTILFRDQLTFRSPTCPLVLGCWELSHVIYLKLTKKQLLVKLEKFQNDSYFYSKQHTRTILSENNHFVYLLSFARSSFFLSMRKITWLNSQQPKTRGHVDHHNDVKSLQIMVCCTLGCPRPM